MSDDALLSTSIEYGIVARSLPFRTMVLKDYLNATGVPPGLRNGNPNADFSPNVSACALASDGYTAKVLWGKRDGSVSIVSHPHTTSKGQAPVRVNTSGVRQEHGDAVLHETWAINADAFVTAGSDGWSKFEVDAILKVVEDLANGLVVAASRSGDIIIFSSLDTPFLSTIDVPPQDIQKLCISTRTFSISDAQSAPIPQSLEILALYLRASSPTKLSILACYRDKSHFYRCSVDVVSRQVDVKTFGDTAFGTIRCIQPVFSDDSAEPSFVIAGTQLGFFSVTSRHIDVFADAHVTSLAMNSFVIIAGSSRGAIKVLDLLTFETLTSFTALMNGDDCDVRQIGFTGNALMGKGRRESHGKWFRRVEIEIRDEIAEYNEYLEDESYRWKRSSDPEREQLMQLRALGLSEQEAVEYALMLSRDEELQRLQSCAGGHMHEEGVFDCDESSGQQSESDRPSSSPTDYYSPPPSLCALTSGFKLPWTLSTEAGGLVGSLPDSQPVLAQGNSSFSPSRSHSQPLLGQASLRATPQKQVHTGDGASSLGKRNAWNKPLPGVSSAASTPAPVVLPVTSGSGMHWGAEAERIRRVEDLELRFALELSLAEAQSRESIRIQNWMQEARDCLH
ncbi:hypothetical protein BJV78DRAFT_1288304 [Lactifluus subvellereus]|nr:hypothetical protein BJV78DRAFT_1288304 [Lactifluus subvellereus]